MSFSQLIIILNNFVPISMNMLIDKSRIILLLFLSFQYLYLFELAMLTLACEEDIM